MSDCKILKITHSKPCLKSTEDIKARAKSSLRSIEDLLEGGQIIATAMSRLSLMIQDWNEMPGVGALSDMGRALDYIFRMLDANLSNLEIETLLK